MSARRDGRPAAVRVVNASGLGWFFLAVMLAAASACSSTRPCRQGSIFLTVNLGTFALATQQLEVDVTIDGVPRSPLTWTPTGTTFATSESLEIDVPSYDTVRTIAIDVVARSSVGGPEIAHDSVTSRAASPGCFATSATLMPPSANGGAGGVTATGGAGGQSTEAGGGRGGSGAQAGAGGASSPGGMTGSAGGGGSGGGNIGTGGNGGAGGSAGAGGNKGGAGTKGGGGTGAGGSNGCGTNGTGAVAVLGCPCTAPGTLACNGNAQAVTLICSNGTWTHNETCMAGNLCDTRAGASKGTCQPIAPACQSATPGQLVCDTAASIGSCGTDLITVATMQTCTGATPACLNGTCVACKPGTTEACGVCNDGTATCDNTGAWGPCIGASSKTTYYRDADGDTFGDPKLSMTVCGAAPTGYVANATDCCDADANAHPGQTAFFTTADACGSSQVPDGFDYNCDGTDTTESSVLNASCVSMLSTTGCGPCPMCYCNSTNGGTPVCGSTSCFTYQSSGCGTNRSRGASGFDGMCSPGGGGSTAGMEGCR